MRYRWSTPMLLSLLERPVWVRDVRRLVVVDTGDEAVPEDLEPPVAERPEGGVVVLALGDLPVVELTRLAGAAEAAERPLLNGVA